jgi:hypothetical protein
VSVPAIGQSASAKATAAKPLTNPDIVEMVKAIFTDSTIIKEIHTNETNFDVSATALLALKNAGVSQAVIEEMLSTSAKTKESKTAAVAIPEPPLGGQDTKAGLYPFTGHISDSMRVVLKSRVEDQYTVHDEYGSTTCSFSEHDVTCHKGNPVRHGTARLEDGREVLWTPILTAAEERDVDDDDPLNYLLFDGKAPFGKDWPAWVEWSRSAASSFQYRLAPEQPFPNTPDIRKMCVPRVHVDKNGKTKQGEVCYLITG